MFKPILAWAGGKRWLWHRLKHFFIFDGHDTYIEPFLGGGAIAFNYMKYCDEHNISKKFIISDANPDLINMYKTIQDSPVEFCDELDKIIADPSELYDKRDAMNANKELNVKRAAQFLWIARSSWRGIFQTNKKGEITGAKGIPPKRIYKREHIMELHRLLKKFADIRCCDFSEYQNYNAIFYLDPPYVGTFDRYCACERVSQERLNNFLTNLPSNAVAYISNNQKYQPPEGAR